jgi:hypothetical protein
MEPVFYVLAIMGCGDGSTACSEARVEPAHYASVQQCQAAMPAVLARNTDLEFPVLSAACRSSGRRVADRVSGAPPS